MKHQNYRVTVQGPAIPLNPSIKQADYDSKSRVVPKGDPPLPMRCNQEEATGQANQNLVENYTIGKDVASLRGEDQAATAQQRNHTTYTKNSKGEFTHQYKDQGSFNKGLGDFVLSNKFEYGYDNNGGRKFASTDTIRKQAIEKNEINNIVENIGQNYKDCVANGANDRKQNFEIKPVKTLMNSTTKSVGDHGNNKIDNVID